MAILAIIYLLKRCIFLYQFGCNWAPIKCSNSLVIILVRYNWIGSTPQKEYWRYIMVNYYLSNKNIGLRALSKEDINENYLSWLNDSETNVFMAAGVMPKRIEDLEEYYQAISKDRNAVHFAIIDMKTKAHIGNVKLFSIDWRNGICEFGILIGDKKHWGKGIATDATKMIVEYAFTKLNLRKVSLGVLKDNIGAVKCYEKAGFIHEGCEKKMYWANDKYCDSLRMGIFNASNEK